MEEGGEEKELRNFRRELEQDGIEGGTKENLVKALEKLIQNGALSEEELKRLDTAISIARGKGEKGER